MRLDEEDRSDMQAEEPAESPLEKPEPPAAEGHVPYIPDDSDTVSLDDLMQVLAPLGADSLEKIAQLMEQKPGREPILTGI